MYLKVNNLGPDPIIENMDIYRSFIERHILDFEVDFGFARPYTRMPILEALFRETHLFMSKHSYLKRKTETDNRFKYLNFLLEMTEDATIKPGGEPLFYFGIYTSREYSNIIPTPPLVSHEKYKVEHLKAFAVKHNFPQVWHALSDKKEIKNYSRIFRQDYGLPKRYHQQKFKDWVLDNLDIYHAAELIHRDFQKEFSRFTKAMFPPVTRSEQQNSTSSTNKRDTTDTQNEFDFGIN